MYTKSDLFVYISDKKVCMIWK